MSGLLRGIARLRVAPALRGSTITQQANIASRPAKHQITLADTVVALSFLTVAFLGPPAYILIHREEYSNSKYE